MAHEEGIAEIAELIVEVSADGVIDADESAQIEELTAAVADNLYSAAISADSRVVRIRTLRIQAQALSDAIDVTVDLGGSPLRSLEMQRARILHEAERLQHQYANRPETKREYTTRIGRIIGLLSAVFEA